MASMLRDVLVNVIKMASLNASECIYTMQER